MPKFAPEKKDLTKSTAKNEKTEFDSGMKIPEINKDFDEGFDFDKFDNKPGNEIEEQEIGFPSEISNKKKKSDKDGILTGGAASLSKKTKRIYPNVHHKINELAVDNISNPIVKAGGVMYQGKEAAENLHMSKANSYMDTNYAKEHLIFKNYKDTNKQWEKYLREKITHEIGADKLDTTKGIYVHSNDESSKRLSKVLLNNQNFNDLLVNKKKYLDLNIPVTGSISFNDKNFGGAIGKSDIRNMHYNKNGDLELYVVDVYDFNKNDSRDLVKIGKERQDKGEIIPYFAIYNVIIPKKKLK